MLGLAKPYGGAIKPSGHVNKIDESIDRSIRVNQ